MPSKPAVSYEEIFQVLKDLPIFDKNKLLKKELNPVWNEAVFKLNNAMKRHNLYLYVFKNRGDSPGIQTNLLDYQFNNQVSLTCELISENQENQLPENLKGQEISKIEIENEIIPVDEYNDIHRLKYHQNFYASIHAIVIKKFYVLYRCPEQLDLCKGIINHNGQVSIIILEGLIKKLKIKTYEPKKVYLVALAVTVEESSTFVLSQALTETFEYSLEDYMKNCFDFLLDEKKGLSSGNEFSAVILRFDMVSLLYTISNLQYMKSKSQKVLAYYQKCFILLSSVTCLEDFADYVKSLLTLMFSTNNSDIVCKEKAKLDSNINDQIETKFQCYENYEKNAQECFLLDLLENLDSDVTSKNNKAFAKYIDELKCSAKEKILSAKSYKKITAYYCPKLFENFKIILSYFPLWTSIIAASNKSEQEAFNSATLSALNHLLIIKENNDMPLQVSEFIKYHLDQCKVSMKKGRSFMKNPKQSVKRFFQNSLTYEEDWKAKNEHSKSTYNKSDASMEIDKKPNNTFSHKVSNFNESSACLEIKPTFNNKLDTSIPNEASIFDDSFTRLKMKPTSQEKLSDSIPDENHYFQNVQLQHTKVNISDKIRKKKEKISSDDRNINIKKKKYVISCPSMRMVHNQQLTGSVQRKESLIQNESGKGLRTICKNKNNIEDTSIIDTICEVIKFAIMNFRDFNNSEDLLCSCTNLCILKMIINFSKSGNLSKFHKARGEFLLNYASVKKDTISIEDTVGVFFSQVMKIHYSFVISTYCVDCNDIFDNYETRLQLQWDLNFNIINLQEIINDFISKEVFCNKCNNSTCQSINFKSYLCIDLEKDNVSAQLNLVPNILKLNEGTKDVKTFALAGIIGIVNKKLGGSVVQWNESIQQSVLDFNFTSTIIPNTSVKAKSKLPSTKSLTAFKIDISEQEMKQRDSVPPSFTLINKVGGDIIYIPDDNNDYDEETLMKI
ncbi:hypothetical protein TKK_0011601 [Trichogramma kaykai]